MIGEVLEGLAYFGLGVAEGKILIGFVPDAVEIATHQGWVSPHRLRTQRGLSLKDARYVLLAACHKGMLYQAKNGRFYPVTHSSGSAQNPTAHVDTRPLSKSPEKPLRIVGFALGAIALVLLILFFSSQGTLAPPPPSTAKTDFGTPDPVVLAAPDPPVMGNVTVPLISTGAPGTGLFDRPAHLGQSTEPTSNGPRRTKRHKHRSQLAPASMQTDVADEPK